MLTPVEQAVQAITEAPWKYPPSLPFCLEEQESLCIKDNVLGILNTNTTKRNAERSNRFRSGITTSR